MVKLWDLAYATLQERCSNRVCIVIKRAVLEAIRRCSFELISFFTFLCITRIRFGDHR